MCSKQHFQKDAIHYLKRATSEHSNLHGCLLLADMFEVVGDLRSAEQAYRSALDYIKTTNDQPLFIEVSLAQIKCSSSDTKAIEDLKSLETILSVSDTDTTRISLKAIIYDTLASYYLKLGKFAAAVNYADVKSITLKMRSLSHYHLSLATNYLLLAETSVRRGQYRDALKYFKNAVEIQCLNLASDNINIKLVYYWMGDICCKMNQLDEARHKYELAENDDDAEDVDEESPGTESFHDRRQLIARASMHEHLAQLYAQRKDFDSAMEEQSSCIDIVKQLYPFGTPRRQMDVTALVANLQQLSFYTVRLADATKQEKSDNPEAIYRKAISIQKKLLRFKEICMGEVYQKIAHYYERTQNDEEMAIAFYQEAVHESLSTEATIITYYTLGRLTEASEEDPGKASIFYDKANSLISENEIQLKSIVQTKCSKHQVLI